ncbi:MAG TPA: winged helix-turn-helix domain-containing protein [Pyrinomonadaceae bacterium]|nr:winged helix-turn-helix domain-containing protein [Pyrinomonadaceae bacterium]
MPRPALIIEDDPDIAETVRYNLETAGFRGLIASTGEQGLTLALDSTNPPALIVLDLMLPGMNGMDLCRRLRKESQTRRIPIIMLTAKASEADRVAGLDVGADDYIAKPFSVRELLARVRAVMRRTEDEGGERYDDGRLAIDFDDVRASCEGTNVKLTNKEFLLLSTLAKKKGRVITRQQLLDQVWGYSYYGDARTLDVHIRRLRQKLDACGDCIETVVGVGYRFTGCGSQRSEASAS